MSRADKIFPLRIPPDLRPLAEKRAKEESRPLVTYILQLIREDVAKAEKRKARK